MADVSQRMHVALERAWIRAGVHVVSDKQQCLMTSRSIERHHFTSFFMLIFSTRLLWVGVLFRVSMGARPQQRLDEEERGQTEENQCCLINPQQAEQQSKGPKCPRVPVIRWPLWPEGTRWYWMSKETFSSTANVYYCSFTATWWTNRVNTILRPQHLKCAGHL